MKPFFLCTLFCFSLTAAASTSVVSEKKAAGKESTEKTMVVLGDSLTEGYGVSKNQAYPAVLEAKIRSSGKSWIVINAGVTGSTSASGVSRLRWLMKNHIDILLLALGANDGLRGLSVAVTEKNLAETIELAQKNGIKVVLAGMIMPPNYGKEYRRDFEKTFVILAQKYKLKRIPFLLDQVGGEIQLNQTDGIHPNEKGHQIIAENVYQLIKDIL